MSSHIRGLRSEMHASKVLHQDQVVPVLIYPKVLRDLGAGQVDICTLERESTQKIIKIYEVKSSLRISRKQMQRLTSSANLLSSIFNLSCRIALYSR